MKEFEIWMEGYAATGEYAPAHYIGKATGETFDEACRNFEYPDDFKNIHYTGAKNQAEYFHRKGEKLNLDNHGGRLSIWACRLYDNETDARKSFG